jgi:hypothetical protein
LNSKIILGNREIIVKLFNAFSFNPNYAIEITNLQQIIDSWAFTAYVSMHLWVHLRYAANTHKPSISRIFGDSIA